MSDWTGRIAAAGRVALDTNALIYFLDQTMPYYPLVATAFRLAEEGRIQLVVPTLAEVEVRIGLLRSDSVAAQARLGLLLDHFPGLSVVPLDRTAAQAAADTRASLDLATPTHCWSAQLGPPAAS